MARKRFKYLTEQYFSVNDLVYLVVRNIIGTIQFSKSPHVSNTDRTTSTLVITSSYILVRNI